MATLSGGGNFAAAVAALHRRTAAGSASAPSFAVHPALSTRRLSISATAAPVSQSGASSASSAWAVDSWKSRRALQIPVYPDKEALEAVLRTLETYPPLVFAGEARKLEERLADAAVGQAFLLQGGDCAESFKEFNANNIRDTFRVFLQMAVVLTFGAQMPIIKIQVGLQGVVVEDSKGSRLKSSIAQLLKVSFLKQPQRGNSKSLFLLCLISVRFLMCKSFLHCA